jgi:hypothetical protein
MSDPVPDLLLYTRPGCHLCAEARAMLYGLLARRAGAGQPTARVVELDISADPDLERRFFDRIPVLEAADRRIELVISPAVLRRFLEEALGAIDAPTAPNR